MCTIIFLPREGMGYDAQVMDYTPLKLRNLWLTHLIVNDDYSIKMCDEFRIVYIQIPTYEKYNIVVYITSDNIGP